MTVDYPNAPGRLAPLLVQWDYMAEQLLARCDGITNAEYLGASASVLDRAAGVGRRRAPGRTDLGCGSEGGTATNPGMVDRAPGLGHVDPR